MAVVARARAPYLVTPVRRRRRLLRLLVSADIVVLSGAGALAYRIRDAVEGVAGLQPFAGNVAFAVAALPIWLVILHAAGAYSPHQVLAGGPGLRRFVGGILAGGVALGFTSFLFNLQMSRLYIGLLVALAGCAGIAVRLGVREMLRRDWRAGRNAQGVLLVGVNDESRAVAEAMARDVAAGYRVRGFLDDGATVGSEVSGIAEVIGPTNADVVDVARDLDAGLVVVAPSAVAPGTLRDITLALEGSEIDLAIAPSLFEVVTRRVSVESVGNVPLLQVEQVRLVGLRAAMKRFIDIIAAFVLMAVLWPAMLAAWVAIRLDSPGPVLFRQARLGKDGRPFTIIKFRTMVADAEERLGEMRDLNEAGHHFFKIRRDPRVTRVGRFLRKWSIDETPQLWNVLRGDMSLVGPRPPLPGEVQHYEPWHRRRLRVRPGLTGMWQVSGRSDVPFDEAVRLDLFYIENWSVGLDLSILARTVRAVLGRDGAY